MHKSPLLAAAMAAGYAGPDAHKVQGNGGTRFMLGQVKRADLFRR